MSFEEAEVLRERAEAFLANAKHLLDSGFYDLAAFNLEQHLQLLVKYKLLVKTGTYPRPHSITRLLGELAKLEPELKKLLDLEDYMLLLTKVEDAYIGARYLPRRYGRSEVAAMLKFVEEVVRPVVERACLQPTARRRGLSLRLRRQRPPHRRERHRRSHSNGFD